ncbi:MAG: hypothetical protein JJV97_01230 [SAR324 cluster bacterium]|nr:hypothetical protein [SAR324 cluster bacterium]
MLDKIAPVRQVASILPKVSALFDVQDKTIPNGNKVIEVVEQDKQIRRTMKVNEIRAIDKVELSTKRS